MENNKKHTIVQQNETKISTKITTINDKLQAGNILLVDLHLRKCVSELKAPQSLHQIDILLDENSIELLVTGFTGAQWIIPIERSGKGFREVLTTCVPSDLTVVSFLNRISLLLCLN